MDINQRIAQWQNMTEADPDNAMGWLSLGTALKDADRYEEAAAALEKAVTLDETLSRGYQLLGQVLIQLDRNDQAGDWLTRGYKMAAERGDVMPQKAMGSLLEKIGCEVPQVESASAPQEDFDPADAVMDRKTGRPGPRLPDPPMRGPIGKFIFDHYSAPTWREWIGQGTKVINELRLDFANEEHQKAYDQQMMEWLGFTMQDVEAYEAQAAGDEAD